jgi:hypothetical protein
MPSPFLAMRAAARSPVRLSVLQKKAASKAA